MALSATYTPALLEDLEPLMKRPQRVMLCEESVALQAVSQFYCAFHGGPQQASGGSGGGQPGEQGRAAAAACDGMHRWGCTVGIACDGMHRGGAARWALLVMVCTQVGLHGGHCCRCIPTDVPISKEGLGA